MPDMPKHPFMANRCGQEDDAENHLHLTNNTTPKCGGLWARGRRREKREEKERNREKEEKKRGGTPRSSALKKRRRTTPTLGAMRNNNTSTGPFKIRTAFSESSDLFKLGTAWDTFLELLKEK
ncbi:hypothetical protein LXL04_025703 [Taraxacum kok-saghyz]